MSTRRHTLIAAALALLGAACSDVTAPIEVRATVVVPDTLVTSQLASSNAQWIQFTLPVSIRNTSSVPLTFSFCGSGIEVRSGDAWSNVWSPYCLLSSESEAPIAPGETRQVTMTITAAVGGAGGPMWGSTSVSGTYRLEAALLADGLSGTIPTISSNAFILKQGN
ncbi:MAG: hypothetical protein JWL61_1147 [Gemmatimonadetes bacterium]|nr:hypothetical protein [Gemmatimonadota bacterium]